VARPEKQGGTVLHPLNQPTFRCTEVEEKKKAREPLVDSTMSRTNRATCYGAGTKAN